MIHVIGAGGTGGWLIPALIKMVNTADIHVWDGDDVEEKNIARQNFTQMDVGEAKAIIMGERFRIGTVTTNYFGDDEMLDIANNDIVIICADNFHVRAVIDEHCQILDDITLINAGNEETATSTQIYIKRNGVEYTPRISYMHNEIARGQTAQELNCAVVANLPGGEQTVAANMLSAALALMALTVAAKWDSSPLRPEARPPFPWHEFVTDMMTGAAAAIDWREDGIGDWHSGT